MRFDILTIFPDLLYSPLQEGIIKRAIASGSLEVDIHNIRNFAKDKHSTTDDRPFGGGEGMVMKPEPLIDALRHVPKKTGCGRVVLLSPQGRQYTQEVAVELADLDQITLICGRYEGFDQRIYEYADDEISIGDYILTGGELAALILVDSVTRLLPGVLGCSDSAACDTFSRGLLKHPQYTRPRTFEGQDVPDVLLSGDHQAIADWRLNASVKQTIDRRPELLKKVNFSKREKKVLRKNGINVDSVIGSGQRTESE